MDPQAVSPAMNPMLIYGLCVLIGGAIGVVGMGVVLRQKLDALKAKDTQNQMDIQALTTQVQTEQGQRQILAEEVQQLRHDNLQLTEKTAEAKRVPVLEEHLLQVQAKAEEMLEENTRLRTAMETTQEAMAAKMETLENVQKHIADTLQQKTGEALQQTQQSLMNAASKLFQSQHEGTREQLSQGQKSFVSLMQPLQERLQEYDKRMAEMERQRVRSHGELSEHLRAVAEQSQKVQRETGRLVSALRSGPKTRGRWGENTLENALELAGLIPHCDFFKEQSFTRDGEQLRPDVLIRLPGDRCIIVDAKCALAAYLDALDTDNEDERLAHLQKHAQQVRTHFVSLSRKEYQRGLTHTPDFVVMFIPGEAFFAAAVEQDPNLFDDALSQGVLITTPTTLIGLAKAIAYGWRQEQVAKDALELSKLGGELYNSMATMAEHVEKLGRNLGNSVDSYNKFVGSLDRNVLSKGRRLKSYQVQQGKKDIPETVNEVLQSPRHWTAPTDMEPIAGAVDSGAVSSGAPAQDQLADTSAPIAESNTPEDPMF